MIAKYPATTASVTPTPRAMSTYASSSAAGAGSAAGVAHRPEDGGEKVTLREGAFELDRSR